LIQRKRQRRKAAQKARRSKRIRTCERGSAAAEHVQEKAPSIKFILASKDYTPIDLLLFCSL